MAAPGILVTRPDNGGDVLLAGPAIRAAAASGRPTYLLCGPRGRPAADLLPGLRSIVEMRLPWIDPDPMPVRRADAGELVSTIRHLAVADALVLSSSHQSPLPLALLLRWAGVERIAAVSHDLAGDPTWSFIPGRASRPGRCGLRAGARSSLPWWMPDGTCCSRAVKKKAD